MEAYRRIYDQFLDNTIDTGAGMGDAQSGENITQIMWPSDFVPEVLSMSYHQKALTIARGLMGVVGGALTPLLYGALSDASNPQWAYAILLPCYLFILFYASKGYKSGLNRLKPL